MMTSETGRAIELVESNQLEATTYPLPDNLEPNGILTKMEAATVCGSDMHSWRGRRPFPMPSILGHEIVGRITETGKNIEKDTFGNPIKEGDRITWTIMSNCGTCHYCRLKRMPQKCESLFKYGHERSDRKPHFNGGFAEYVHVIPGTSVFKIPDNVSSSVAATLMCAGATVAAGLDNIKIDPMDNIVIQGSGLLGLYATSLAELYGAKNVITIDIEESRLEMAKSFGADATINASDLSDEDLVNKVKQLTGGRGADVAFEVTGAPEVIPIGVDLLTTGGKYVLHGSVYPDDEFTLDGHDVITKNLTIRGVHNYDAPHLGTVIEFVSKYWDKYPFESLVGPSFPLTAEGVDQALHALENREGIRPIVRPE